MVGGCWRIPVNSLRAEPLLSTADDSKTSAPPPYLQRLINRLDAFDTGMVPCADAAEIAGIGVKAMRNGLRSGRIPGGRLVGGSWLVTVADLGAWLGVQRVA